MYGRFVYCSLACTILLRVIDATSLAFDPPAESSNKESPNEQPRLSDLIATMVLNDKQLDRVIVHGRYTGISRPPKLSTNLRVPVAPSLRPPKTEPPPEQQGFNHNFRITHSADVSRESLPDGKTLFLLAVQHNEEIKSGNVENFKRKLNTEQIRWLELLIDGSVSVKAIPETTTNALEPVPEIAVVEEVSTELFALRWPDLIVIDTPESLDSPVELPRRWSSINGQIKSVRASMDVQIGREWMNDTREIVSSLNSYQELALWRIFSLGVGYASRLVSVESETVVDDRTVVVGKLEIWPGKTAPATLDIDSQGVVRSAEIDAGVTELIIKTEGLRQYSEDFRAATTGHFVRRYKRDLNSTAPSFRYNVESIEFELSKSKFDELADISPPPGEHVSDVSPDASRKLEPYPEVSSNGAGTFRTVMMVNGLILLLFGIALYVRRKRAV